MSTTLSLKHSEHNLKQEAAALYMASQLAEPNAISDEAASKLANSMTPEEQNDINNKSFFSDVPIKQHNKPRLKAVKASQIPKETVPENKQKVSYESHETLSVFDTHEVVKPVLFEPTKKQKNGEDYSGVRMFRRGARNRKAH